MDQNNIILILLLIAVLVAFYAIYLAMENSKRIKKVSLEMVDLAKLIQESSSLPPQHILQREDQPPAHPFPNQREDLDEYPTLDEVNTELNEQVVEEPLDENLKNQIDNLDNLDEEALLNLERQLDAESRENDEASEAEENEAEENEAEENEAEENEASEVEENEAEASEAEEVEESQAEEVEESQAEEETTETVPDEESSNEYPVLGELTEDGLNELNCEELREICKREELRTRGRKAELVERIIKKRDALA